MLSNLIESYNDIKEKFEYLRGVKESIEKSIHESTIRIKEIDDLIDLYSQTSIILQKVSESVRDKMVSQIEGIVTNALQEIYDPNYEFKIRFENKRGTINTYFKLFEKSTGRELDLCKSSGGGIRNIIATTLRIVFTELVYPKITGPILLDEAGVNISSAYLERFGRFLKVLSEKLKRQIILVSHQKEVIPEAHSVIEVKKEGDKSVVILPTL